MSDPYNTPAISRSFEYIERRSRFIAFVQSVASREEVAEALKQLRNVHPKANHVCYGFIAGCPSDAHQWGFSDDGEPGGTAGKPILNILQHSGLGQILVAVVRYFGGTKLGTGGLVHAYSAATQGVLHELPVRVFENKTTAVIACAYSRESKIRKLLLGMQVTIVCCVYGDRVKMEVELSEDQLDQLNRASNDLPLEYEINLGVKRE